MSLNQTTFEILNDKIQRGGFRFALFDFDGTLSLVREGWQHVMIPLLTEWLAECPKAESRRELDRLVREYVAGATGMQTIYQMIWLAEQVRQRGGKAMEPPAYKGIYNDRLNEMIRQRIEDLKMCRARQEEWLVPGAKQVLAHLRQLGCTIFCASGTDHEYVLAEARLLGIADFFDGGIYGATDDYVNSSKRILIQKIIRDHNLGGSELLAFGDGYVEIEDTKSVGGMAVGVASDEVHRQGVDPAKRARLIEAGADVIIPDFREEGALLNWLFLRE